jgi:hypothetical protein
MIPLLFLLTKRPRLLLTSGQVSIVLSAAVIVVSAIALFLAGYALQQHSLSHLHAALRPRTPNPRHGGLSSATMSPLPLLARAGLMHADDRAAPFDWTGLAYASLIRTHAEACAALVALAGLHRAGSAAPKALLFPRAWLRERGGAAPLNDALDASLRLVRAAARRYRAVLVPVGPIDEEVAEHDGAFCPYFEELRWTNEPTETDPRAYSIVSAFALTNYERVLILPTPGLVLNARPLDSMLAFYEPHGNLSVFPLPAADHAFVSSSPSPLMLLRPSADTFRVTSAARRSTSVSDEALLRELFPEPEPLLSDADPDFKPSLFTTSRALRTWGEQSPAAGFNATDFYDRTAYLLLEDEALPGPEYDVPYQRVVDMRPRDDDLGFVWEKMYNVYKDRRYRVCGLDPLSWPPKE